MTDDRGRKTENGTEMIKYQMKKLRRGLITKTMHFLVSKTLNVTSFFEGVKLNHLGGDTRYILHPRGVKLDSLFAFRFSLSSRRSFGLIEVLVSGIVMVTVIGASVSVRQRAGAESAVARHQAQAYLLAQEGIEAVRQIRDTNYLATQKASDTAPSTKRPWDCGLTTKVLFGANVLSKTFQTCDPTNKFYSITPDKQGDFSPRIQGGTVRYYNSLELGNGQTFGGIFRNELDSTQLFLPTWHLSNRSPLFDGGTILNNATTNMLADGCEGAERIFVRDGEGEPSVPQTSIVMQNRREPSNRVDPQVIKTQENYRGTGASAAPDYCDVDRGILAGYVEYRRQVFATPRFLVANTINTNESPGNLPSAWNDNTGVRDISKHQIQVLVRVSWKEVGRNAKGTNQTSDQFAVLLATYLSDWRKVN